MVANGADPRNRDRTDTSGSRASTAALTRAYIETHPSVRDALRMGIVNYSALSRLIVEGTGISSEEAVIAALRRHEEAGPLGSREGEIMSILSESRLIMKTKVSIVSISGSWSSFKTLDGLIKLLSPSPAGIQVIQGIGGITIILEDDQLENILGLVRPEMVSGATSRLVQINVVSPVRIVETSGVMAYLTDALSTNGINALEVLSCYTDTVIMVKEGDMSVAFDTLKVCMGGMDQHRALASTHGSQVPSRP